MSDANTSREEQAIDAEHTDVIEEEQREKRDENEDADRLVHGEDLPVPKVEP